jgi:hypothetical protein
MEGLMRLEIGKHMGKTTEEVLLKHPDYAQWMIGYLPVSLHQEIIWRMQDFDDKPFTKGCHGKCGRKSIIHRGATTEGHLHPYRTAAAR